MGRRTRSALRSAVLLPFFPLSTLAGVTLYNGVSTSQSIDPSATTSAHGSYVTNLPAYDTTRLTAPAALSPPLSSYSLSIPSPQLLPPDRSLSIPIKGNLLGFSIELSVADSLLGASGGVLKPEFLNYLANIRNRAGVGPQVRVGGNSQEGSTIFVDGLDNGKSIEKIKVSDRPTDTPIINYSLGLLQTMANISTLVDTEWFFGLAFNETDVSVNSPNVPIAAEYATRILGSNLKGLQIGNEPDLYTDHNKRPTGWNVTNYVQEWSQSAQNVLANSPATSSEPPLFLGPSLCCERVGFELDDVLNAGWLTQNTQHISGITVQQYPSNNCQINGQVINPQDIFASFLNHSSAEYWTAPYANVSAVAAANGKDLKMLEMNSASCGGFPGLSDSFGVAMWIADWALQLATFNFTTVLMHVGGQNVYYNPFTPPPSNMTQTLRWTTGSVYYATLLIAETFSHDNNSRIVDLSHHSSIPTANSPLNNPDGTPMINPDGSQATITTSNDIYHPSYVIYDGDTPSRAVLFNYISDPSGASDTQVTLSFNGTNAPASVSVRYLRAKEVSEQYDITWSNLTMGASFASDGTLRGTQQTLQLTCTNGNCIIPVPAPSVALVFFTAQGITETTPTSDEVKTFATTVIGKGTATIDPKVLETSNGQNGDGLGSSSKGSSSAAGRRSSPSTTMAWLIGFTCAAALLLR